MNAPASTSLGGLFGRLLWTMFGPLALALFLIGIISRGDGWLTPVDVAYFVALAATLLGRWWEFRAGNPLTLDGEPATPGHLRRYLLWTGTVGLLAWVAANLVTNHWLTR